MAIKIRKYGPEEPDYEGDKKPERIDPTKPDYQEGRHRKGDHKSSIDGAKKASERASKHKLLLLTAYYDHPDGLINEEAEKIAQTNGKSPWKRSGELRKKGWIEYIGETRLSESQVECEINRITDLGREVYLRSTS